MRGEVQASSAALIEVSDRLTWSLHRDGQVEGEGATVCSLVCQGRGGGGLYGMGLEEDFAGKGRGGWCSPR